MEAFTLFIAFCLIGLAVIYLISGIDDFFVDVIAYIQSLRPKKISNNQLNQMKLSKQKHIAVMIPAWMEGEIIDRMLLGNQAHLEYKNFHFFVGIYPNDNLAIGKLNKLSKDNSNIHVVINDRPGPTTKGQILNYVVQKIFEQERKLRIKFDAIHMQDAEDIMHPKILQLVNRELDNFDFIQTPVFSMQIKNKDFVAGTYVDEFAESHTKDILVRQYLGAAVPSAGVGTTLSRALILKLLETKNYVFREGSLTEDYELGNLAKRLGFTASFACFYYDLNKKREYISTREYFPKKINQSIRQKTRWTLGIALQGWRQVGWWGDLKNNYFLFRDRKGLLTNISVFLGYPLIIMTFFLDMKPIYESNLSMFNFLFLGNLFLLSNRLGQKAFCTGRVYGVQALLGLPFRWLLGNYINAMATFRAIQQDTVAQWQKKEVKWAKTEHELPENFGLQLLKESK